MSAYVGRHSRDIAETPWGRAFPGERTVFERGQKGGMSLAWWLR